MKIEGAASMALSLQQGAGGPKPTMALGQAEQLVRTGDVSEAGGGRGPRVQDFGEAIAHAIEGVNRTQVRSDETVGSFLAGGDVSPHQVMVALSKADLSLRLTSAVTTKAISAYQEISRMQI